MPQPKLDLSATTESIRDYVRQEAKNWANEKGRPLNAGEIKYLSEWGAKAVAMSLLKEKKVKPDHHCTICNGKGYAIFQGKFLEVKHGKKVYEHSKEACWCIHHTIQRDNIPDTYTRPDEPKPDQGAAPKKKRAPRKSDK